MLFLLLASDVISLARGSIVHVYAKYIVIAPRLSKCLN